MLPLRNFSSFVKIIRKPVNVNQKKISERPYLNNKFQLNQTLFYASSNYVVNINYIA
jgi:hypothetical protein